MRSDAARAGTAGRAQRDGSRTPDRASRDGPRKGTDGKRGRIHPDAGLQGPRPKFSDAELGDVDFRGERGRAEAAAERSGHGHRAGQVLRTVDDPSGADGDESREPESVESRGDVLDGHRVAALEPAVATDGTRGFEGDPGRPQSGLVQEKFSAGRPEQRSLRRHRGPFAGAGRGPALRAGHEGQLERSVEALEGERSGLPRKSSAHERADRYGEAGERGPEGRDPVEIEGLPLEIDGGEGLPIQVRAESSLDGAGFRPDVKARNGQSAQAHGGSLRRGPSLRTDVDGPADPGRDLDRSEIPRLETGRGYIGLIGQAASLSRDLEVGGHDALGPFRQRNRHGELLDRQGQARPSVELR